MRKPLPVLSTAVSFRKIQITHLCYKCVGVFDGGPRKSDNEFDDVKLNIKTEGQREAKTRGDICHIRRRYIVCNLI